MKYAIVNQELFASMVEENLISSVESIWKKALVDAEGDSKQEYLGGFRPEFKLEDTPITMGKRKFGILTAPIKVPGVLENKEARFSRYSHVLLIYVCEIGKGKDYRVAYVMCNKKDFASKKVKPECDVTFADRNGNWISRRLASCCTPVAYHDRTVIIDPVMELQPGFELEMPTTHVIKSYSRDNKRNKRKWDSSHKKVLRSLA